MLSPSTRAVDRGIEAERLLEIGGEEVGLVDPTTRTIEVRPATARAFARGEERAVSQAPTGSTLVPARLFTPPA